MQTLFFILLHSIHGIVDQHGRVINSEIPNYTPEIDPKDVPDIQWTSPQIYNTMRHEMIKFDNEWMRLDGIRLYQYYQLANFTCGDRLLWAAELSAEVNEKLEMWHLNFTGTSGLFWLTKDMPPDTDRAWAWMIYYFFEKVMLTVDSFVHRLGIISTD